MDSAVLLLAYARPRETLRVARAVASADPSQVFVALDGPRPEVPTDHDRCAAVRDLLETMPWPGDVNYLVADENLGSRLWIPSAIDWAFEFVDRLIILEDDCLPNDSFFRYCVELLRRYEAEPSVAMVAGTNPAQWRGGPSYRLSRYGTTWGWATWASAWGPFRRARDLLEDPTTDTAALAEQLWADRAEQGFWAETLRAMRGSVAGWDTEWLLARLLDGGLTAIPRRNLVTNIGFGAGATNTFSSYSHPIGPLRRHKLRFPLTEPDGLTPDPRIDKILSAGHLDRRIPGVRGFIRALIRRSRGKVDSILKRNEFSRRTA